MIKSVRKLIAMGILVSSICLIPTTEANAEWRQNVDNTWSYDNISNGWFKDNNNWYFFKDGIMKTGWLNDNGKWYYLKNDGSMASNETTPDGFKVDGNGVWIQNNTINNVANTNTSNSINSNNMTNLTNNIDNSKNTSNTTTLNNTGVINANTTNDVDVTVNNTSKEENNYYKQLKETQQKRDDDLKVYYQKQLAEAKQNLAEAKADLSRVQSQKTVQTYEKDPITGTYQFVYTVDKSKIDSAQKRVDRYEEMVSFYENLIK